jgi:hypothetical protein
LTSEFAQKYSGGYALKRQLFFMRFFYAQAIKKFVIAILDLIESCRTVKKVSANQKTLKGNV